MIYVKGFWNPTIVKTTEGSFAVSGSNWVPVPDDTTLKDIKFVSITPIKRKSTNKEWNVAGSRGSNYKVKWNGTFYSCTCIGYSYRRSCKHVNEISDMNKKK